jgi:DNA-binding beta-propeller fold protein YncE
MIHAKAHRTRVGLTALLAAAAVAGLPTAPAAAALAPVKESLETEFGWNVNRTAEEAGAPQAERNVCVLAKDECQAGQNTSELGAGAGGFAYPVGVAVGSTPDDYLYVADHNNERVQVITPQGAFVSMFGWDVNKTKAGEGAPQAERDICTAESHDECQGGQPSSNGPAGAIESPTSIAVDQSTHDVYVLDHATDRVVKYTATGEFIWMIGGEVNETQDNNPTASEAQKNICTAEELAKGTICKTGVERPAETRQHGAFKLENERGNLLAVGPAGVLYVGGEGGVQEFEPDGQYEAEIEIPFPQTVRALAVDAAGDVYLVDEGRASRTIHKFASDGTEITTTCSPGSSACWPLTLSPRESTATSLRLSGLAVDPAGRLATTVSEESETFGLLLNGETGETVSEFKLGLRVARGITFDSVEVAGGFEMYLAEEELQEVLAYAPARIGALALIPAACAAGAEHETDASFNCTLSGEANPWGVAQTEAGFQWGSTTALGATTPLQSVCAASCANGFVPVPSAVVQAPPNETFYERLVGYDEHAPASAKEPIASSVLSFATPMVTPDTAPTPSALAVHPSSATIFGELNPENARSEYFFEYGPQGILKSCPHGVRSESCPGVSTTATQESEAYLEIGAAAEIVGLQPSSSYEYRLFAESENKAKTAKRASSSPASLLTTAPAPVARASTGAAGAVATTSALIAGTVDPDGLTATYAFELGVYQGAATQYGTVFSGPAGEGVNPIEETLPLTGLQPGTTYAYRITITSAYGTSQGSPMTFTTSGLPAVLVVPSELSQLPIPPIAYPVNPSSPKHAKAKKAKKHVRKKRKAHARHKARSRKK